MDIPFPETPGAVCSVLPEPMGAGVKEWTQVIGIRYCSLKGHLVRRPLFTIKDKYPVQTG